MTPVRRERALVRPHVVTGGRAYPSRNTLALETLVKAARPATPDLTPEQTQVMRLCRGGALSVAEVSAHLPLPVGFTRVVLGDLIDSGHLFSVAPLPHTDVPSLDLLQELLDGLRALP